MTMSLNTNYTLKIPKFVFTVDPRTTWVWTMWVHLYLDFFHSKYYKYYTIHGWLNLQIQNQGYRETLAKEGKL